MKRERERERYPGDSVNKPSVTQESPVAIINPEKTKLAIMRALILLSLISIGIWQSVLTAGRLGSGWKYFWSELFTPQEPVHTLRENCVAQAWHSHGGIACAERARRRRVWAALSPRAAGCNGECAERSGQHTTQSLIFSLHGKFLIFYQNFTEQQKNSHFAVLLSFPSRGFNLLLVAAVTQSWVYCWRGKWRIRRWKDPTKATREVGGGVQKARLKTWFH